MDFYYTIKNLTDDQIKELISLKIAQARYQSLVFSNRFIGVDCDINPTLTLEGEPPINSQCMWQGFIPEDVKIVYSYKKNEQGYTVNNGCYYYIDNHDYLYEFACYIKNQEIKTETEFLCHVYNFIENYFYNLSLKEITREEMQCPLLDKYGKYIEPTSLHVFSDFKGSNNALCSEYSVIAQNILSIFGYKMIYFDGSVKAEVGRGGHVFNFTLVGNTPCIMDFKIPINVYDIEGRLIRRSPFLGAIENFDPEILKDHILNHTPYHFNDYFSVIIDTKEMLYPNGKERSYVIGNVEYYNKKGFTKKYK